MPTFFNKPFPFEYNPRKELRFLTILTLFPGFFLIVFKPFGISTNLEGVFAFLVVLGFGLVTGFVAGMYTLIFPLILKKWYWKFTIGKAIIHYSSMIIFIAIGNYLYKSYWQGYMNWSWEEFFVVFYRTLILAVIPTIGIIIWYQNHLLKKHLQSAKEFNDKLGQKLTEFELCITSDNQKEQLRIPSKDLRYIENQDNYVMVYYHSQSTLNKKLIRTSLQKIQNELKDPKLIRCHRSFIVNLNAVKHVQGNSRGLILELNEVEENIPVSRSYIKKVQQQL